VHDYDNSNDDDNHDDNNNTKAASAFMVMTIFIKQTLSSEFKVIGTEVIIQNLSVSLFNLPVMHLVVSVILAFVLAEIQ